MRHQLSVGDELEVAVQLLLEENLAVVGPVPLAPGMDHQFSGIAVSDLKLSRRGSSSDQAFFVAPSAVLYHDKEQLNRGRLVIKKIELENPELTLERMADGRWNLAGILRVGPADRPVPTFVTKGATLTIIGSFFRGPGFNWVWPWSQGLFFDL